MECRQIRWKRCNEFSKVGDIIYLIKQDSDDIYTFKDVAVDIIDIISHFEQCTIEELIAKLDISYDLEEESKEEVISFLKELKKENILEII